MADKDRKNLIVIVLVLGLAWLFVAMPASNIGQPEENWQNNYKEQALAAGLDPEYLEHDNIVDTNPDMDYIAQSISTQSVNAKDAVKKTMDYVYDTVAYTPSPPGCFDETSSDVFVERTGNCVSMTKIALSLLRAQGIAARPVGGCISGNFACNALFSFHPERQPRYVPVVQDDNFKRGGLHEWLEIWLPDEGWIYGEATSGQLFPRSCSSYDIHDYNTDAFGMCVITDQNYIRQCARF